MQRLSVCQFVCHCHTVTIFRDKLNYGADLTERVPTDKSTPRVVEGARNEQLRKCDKTLQSGKLFSFSFQMNIKASRHVRIRGSYLLKLTDIYK